LAIPRIRQHALVYQHDDDQHKAAALKHSLTWCLTEGQAFNEALGYIRLAPQVGLNLEKLS
jgi:hypothetical protein